MNSFNAKNEIKKPSKILVVWKNLKVGGIVGGWRSRSVAFSQYGIQTEFLFLYDKGGSRLIEGIARYYVTNQRDKIVKLIQENKYDCIFVIDSNEMYSILAESQYTGPIIIESRIPYKLRLKKELQGIKEIAPSAFIVASEFQKSLVSKFIPGNLSIEVIPNTIDTGLFKPMNNMPRSSHKKIIAWIGRVSRGKNWRFFLEVVNEILKIRDDVHFWLITTRNSSIQLRLLKEKLEQMNITNHLSWFHNHFDYSMMPEVYSQIAHSGGTLFSTTKRESFGNIFIEAMGCNCPVVAPNHSAIQEIISHGQNGLLYNLKSKESAVQELNKILDNQVFRESIVNTALEDVQEKYGVTGIFTLKYVNLIKNKKQTGLKK